MSVAGIILAAGESRRMGFPKALLRYRDETFLDTLIGQFAARCQPVIVVLGAHAERIREHTLRPATFVINTDYQRGQTGSMQCGLRAVPAGAEGVLFTLVDHPAVSPATLDALLGGAAPRQRLRSAGPCAAPPGPARPSHLVFQRELIAEFLELPENGAARDVVRGHAAQTEFLDMDDAGILADIDDPEAYVRLTGAPCEAPPRSAVQDARRIAGAAVDRRCRGAIVYRRSVWTPVAGVPGTRSRAAGRNRQVHFNLFKGPGFSVDNVTIYEDPSIGMEPMVYIQEPGVHGSGAQHMVSARRASS